MFYLHQNNVLMWIPNLVSRKFSVGVCPQLHNVAIDPYMPMWQPMTIFQKNFN